MAEASLNSEICWFCRNGRHKECMHTIPITRPVPGPHDCSFDSAKIACICGCD